MSEKIRVRFSIDKETYNEMAFYAKVKKFQTVPNMLIRVAGKYMASYSIKPHELTAYIEKEGIGFLQDLIQKAVNDSIINLGLENPRISRDRTVKGKK